MEAKEAGKDSRLLSCYNGGMEMTVQEQFKKSLTLAGLSPGDKVLVGVSGGRDSMVLLDLFATLGREAGLLPVAAHIHHGLRGRGADKDQALVEKAAGAYGLPFRFQAVDVKGAIRQRGASLEEAARTLRYEALEAMRQEEGCRFVAVAHHQGDQGETLLLHLIRGTGIRGLKGMLPLRGTILRPLLEASREEVRRYGKEKGIAFREDRSNASLAYRRNWIRHRLLPLFRKLNPRAEEALARTARLLARDWAFLEEEGERAYQRLAAFSGSAIRIDRAVGELPPALAYRVLEQAGRALGLQHLEARWLEGLLAYLGDAAPGEAFYSLPGNLRAHLDQEALILDRKEEADSGVLHMEIQGPGTYQLPGGSLTLELLQELPPGLQWQGLDPGEGYLDAGKAPFPLLLRNWQPGDRFQPLGWQAEGKVKSLFSGRKVPASRRHILPLLEERGGKLLFIPWLGTAEGFGITSETRIILHISYRGKL